MLVEGQMAPEVDLPTDSGNTLTLSKLRGKPVVVYFYPKDDTSGCTLEAKAFTDRMPAFKKLGAEVVGISPDSVKSHCKFRDKYELQVTLAADGDHKVAEAWGVWVEKSMYGRKYMGVERSTFLIDKTGKIVGAWHKVKVPGHVDKVLAAVAAL